MGFGQAIWIRPLPEPFRRFPGTCQAPTIVVTIAAGQISGFSRTAALEFSFLLSIPTMVAATGYDF